MKKNIKWCLLFLSFITFNATYFISSTKAQTPAQKAEQYFCTSALEDLPVLHSGRTKPLYVVANEELKYLTGSTRVGQWSATESYCLLSLKNTGMPLPKEILEMKTRIEHVETRKYLNLTDENPLITFAQLVNESENLQKALMMQKEESSYKKDLNKLLGKIRLYEQIASGADWNVPHAVNEQIEWIPIIDFIAKFPPSSSPFKKAKEDYVRIEKKNHRLELFYAKSHLASWALVSTLGAMALFILVKNMIPGLIATAITLLLQIGLTVLRVIISERAPITNMYETVLFSGLGALIIACIIGHLKNEKRFLLAGLGYNTCTLMMLNFAGGMLNPQIGPLVPVLRDNFWLSTHVTTIILSYGALALSWMLSNIILLQKRFGNEQTKENERYFIDLVYACLKVGCILLAAGIILGGVWADYSWGRFWGWDPKETWSLIVLCLYMAILHGKSTSWIPPQRFIPLVAGAFLSVMMAWFGVNYILASGLHSYGFSEGGALFLICFFVAQIALLIVTHKGSNKKVLPR